jgi:hypothetical protein
MITVMRQRSWYKASNRVSTKKAKGSLDKKLYMFNDIRVVKVVISGKKP